MEITFFHYKFQPLLRSSVHGVPYGEGQNEIPPSLGPITSIGKRIPPATLVKIRESIKKLYLICSWYIQIKWNNEQSM